MVPLRGDGWYSSSAGAPSICWRVASNRQPQTRRYSTSRGAVKPRCPLKKFASPGDPHPPGTPPFARMGPAASTHTNPLKRIRRGLVSCLWSGHRSSRGQRPSLQVLGGGSFRPRVLAGRLWSLGREQFAPGHSGLGPARCGGQCFGRHENDRPAFHAQQGSRTAEECADSLPDTSGTGCAHQQSGASNLTASHIVRWS